MPGDHGGGIHSRWKAIRTFDTSKRALMNRRKFLTAMTASSIASIALPEMLEHSSAETPAAIKRPALAHPNLVLFICDDLGHGDLSCYGGPLQTVRGTCPTLAWGLESMPD